MLLISTPPHVPYSIFLNTAYKEFITEEAQYREVRIPPDQSQCQAKNRRHIWNKSQKNKHIPFQKKKIIMKKYKQLYKY